MDQLSASNDFIGHLEKRSFLCCIAEPTVPTQSTLLGLSFDSSVDSNAMNYWLAVIGKLDVVMNLDEHLWWCFPKRALKGDRVFLYCPRSLSSTKQGVFAECELVSIPFSNKEEDQRCSGYGRSFGAGAALGFVELKLISRFEKSLTAQEMKRDRILRDVGFVRRSFQGTTFSIPQEAVKRLRVLTNRKMTRE